MLPSTSARLRRAATSSLTALLLGLGLLVTPAPATAAPATAAVVEPAASRPSAPIVKKTKGGDFFKVSFKVKRQGGERWSQIQARGLKWDGDQRVGSCRPPALRSGGTWIAGYPTGPGRWSFSVRVRNSAGWSAWSAYGKRVTIR